MSALDAFRLEGRLALITGGGSGLGFAIAQTFVGLGAEVVIVGKDEGKLQRAIAELGAAAPYRAADITDSARVADLVAALADERGKLDVLVNNAGNHLKKTYEETSIEDFRLVLDTHVVAGFNLTRLCLPLLGKAEGASILFVASMASYLAIPRIIAYTAAKSAVMGLVRGTAAEVSAMGIRANGIAPGWISSPMTDKALASDPPRLKKVLDRTPMGRMGEAQDIGYAAAYLASPAARFVNGHVLVVDGGAVHGF